MLITPFAFYHIVTNFSIGSVFGVQVNFFKTKRDSRKLAAVPIVYKVPTRL
jgi:hypothetical protein